MGKVAEISNELAPLQAEKDYCFHVYNTLLETYGSNRTPEQDHEIFMAQSAANRARVTLERHEFWKDYATDESR